MKATSHTTSNDLELIPMTTPFTARGTLPESCTITTLSPKENVWFCSRYTACAGFSIACRGIFFTIAFLTEPADLFVLHSSANWTICDTVSCAINDYNEPSSNPEKFVILPCPTDHKIMRLLRDRVHLCCSAMLSLHEPFG